MPIYTYKCKKCGKVFEWSQSIKSKPLEHCPEGICEEEVRGKGEVERVISKNIGLIFKGSGFYLTDYSKKNSSAASSSEHSSLNSSNGTVETASVKDKSKTETKSTASTDTVGKNSAEIKS